MNERIIYTLTIITLLIFIGFYSTWYITLLTIGLAITCTMFGITAKREGWVL